MPPRLGALEGARARAGEALGLRVWAIKSALRQRLSASVGLDWTDRFEPKTALQRIACYLGIPERPLARVVMDREIIAHVRSLDSQNMCALEISGRYWASFGFTDYQSADYPEFDVCHDVLEREAFDIIFCEQVFEHVRHPARAARNVYQMLRPGGLFVISTPFMICRHDAPVDCTRWTPLGLLDLLAEAGFSRNLTETHSWGNRQAVKAGLQFPGFAVYLPWWHSLRNEEPFPVVVWAFARKGRREPSA